MDRENIVSTPIERVVALDKIRYMMVAGVVVLHAACAYSSIIPWWGVREVGQSGFYDLLVFVSDIFLMPVLYFIAGFFALSSLTKHGAGGFVIAKLKRLGGPLVLLGIFFVPSISFIGYLDHTPNPAGFLQFWWMQMQTVFERDWVLYTSMEVAAKHPNDYSPWHLWFLYLLLIFFILTAVSYRLFPRLFARNSASLDQHVPGKILPGLLAAIAGGALFTALVLQFSPDWAWGKIGFFLIQPARVPIYAALFGLGLYANSRNWLTNRRFPGQPWLWLVAACLLFFALSAVSQNVGPHPAPIPWPQAILLGGLRTLTCLAFLCLFLAIGKRWGQQPSSLWRFTNPVSYDIYLVHLPFVVLLQLGALQLPIPTGLKFVLISLAALLACGLFSRWVIKPHPRLAVLLLFVLFGFSALLI